MKKDGKDIKGGRCIKRKDGRLDFSETDRKKIRKNHIKKIMNKKNEWGHVREASMKEGPIKYFTCKKQQ